MKTIHPIKAVPAFALLAVLAVGGSAIAHDPRPKSSPRAGGS